MMKVNICPKSFDRMMRRMYKEAIGGDLQAGFNCKGYLILIFFRKN